MSASLVIQSIIDGILIGGIYALVAIGLTLIFGVMKIINFAQGSLMMLGMYVTYWCYTLFGINPYLSIPLSALTLFFIGSVLQKGILEKLTGAPEHNQLLVTLGIMLVIENLALVLWSPNPRKANVPGLEDTFNWGVFTISKPKLIAFLFAIVLTAILYWFLQKTFIGKAIRGTSIDRDGAALVGIHVGRINMMTFGLGASLAAVAGTLITPFLYTTPTIGHTFILKAFVVVVLGGLGNFYGALVGGLMIGVGESLGGVFLPGSLKELTTYIIFVAVLLFRPTGLFGREAQ